jgi:hypothetical protein
MNSCGACEHTVTEHHLGWGRCAGQAQDPVYGSYACVCPHFEKDSND